MKQTALITGGFGFLGRAVARKYQTLGYRVLGIGHGAWTADEAQAHGFDVWHQAEVSRVGLSALTGPYDVVVHCASNSSVAYSLSNPHEAFQRTVDSTIELLEHLRQLKSKALVIYPSSAAVYGAAEDRPLRETDTPNPVSPYGVHKKITEELLACQARHFGTRVAIIRFFSIYGAGLAKQLLWDAAGKLCSSSGTSEFWGTGEETRDWIHVEDAAALVARLAETETEFTLVNGAAGERVTVRAVLEKLRNALGLDVDISFNGIIRPGDPRFYHADMSRLRQLNWQPAVSLEEGLQDYAQWFKASCSK